MNALVKSQIERGQKKNMKIKLEASTKLIMQLKLVLNSVLKKIDDHFEVEQPITPADWEEKLANEEAFTAVVRKNTYMTLYSLLTVDYNLFFPLLTEIETHPSDWKKRHSKRSTCLFSVQYVWR